MITTLPSGSKIALLSQELNFDALAAKKIAQREPENVQAEVETWGAHCKALRKATVNAIAASRIALRNYKKVQAEADRWERQLQLALEDDSEDLVKESLWQRNSCRDRARNLKALVEKHSVQIDTLRSQLAFWENQ